MAASRNKSFTDPVVQAVAACLARHAGQAQSLVVGFSGGLDSAVLLHAASCVTKDIPLDLSALHVHHGLSASADAWAESCAQVCQELGVPLDIVHVEVPRRTGEGIEAAARSVRHRMLAGHHADWILLAHHADDQAETILHNLLRGAGVRGAGAMPESRDRVLRPLLGLARGVLCDYARRNRLVWIEDESNADKRYTRNFLRHEILPRITSRFPRAGAQLAAAASRFSEADSLLETLASLDLGDNSPEFPLPLELFRELPDVRARNLLRAMLTWHHAQPPDERRLNEFVRQLQTAGKDRHPRLDLVRYTLWCAAGRLHFKNLD
jgi:tRNA(Ile)-lysidine synthase